MGRSGPQKTPTAKLKLLGSPVAQYERKNEPQVSGTPVPPAWLDGVAREHWNEMVPELKSMGVVGVSDTDALAVYCEAYGEFCLARDFVKEHGHLAVSNNGTTYQHPMVGIKNKAVERMNKIGSQFGWSASSRAGLNVSPDNKGKLSEFLTG